MLLIILGAGASHDALPDYPVPEQYPERLPLANDLFNLRYANELDRFRRISGIVPFLRSRGSGVALETRLQELAEEGGDDRLRELLAVRFYLQYMISGYDRGWNERAKGVTNYRTLLGDVLRGLSEGEAAAIVTFNYDRMVEWAMRDIGMEVDSLGDYLRFPLKLFKIHGSVDWARKISRPVLADLGDNQGGWRSCLYTIDHAQLVEVTEEYVFSPDVRPIQVVDQSLVIPALQIPLIENKKSELPKDHKDALEGILKETSRVPVIGWKGADAHFRELIADVEADGLVVSPKNPEETITNLRECRRLRLEARTESFTTFATERHVRELL
jgi:hypothetical protein